jgi:salicylate 5-hydroxylase small subunit
MIQDRVYGVKETMYHDPYYQRHIVGTPRVIAVTREGGVERIQSEANYTVIRTKYDGDSTVFSVGYYSDVVVRTPEGLKLQSRLCVYDSEMIANSVIYPI